MLNSSEFDENTLEKVSRMCDILHRISSVDYTRERLSLYGGTSLNFLHFRDIPRLSLDIDFNYRDKKIEEWWKERDRIDDMIKRILSDLGYTPEDIRIQATYPLTRFTLHYKTKMDQKDSIKIEIGYMRRIPVFEEDIKKTFTHIETGREIELKTPIPEEIFGNKFCTLLYRYKDQSQISSRDLFDVYQISQQNLEEEMFLTALVMDSLMRPEPRIYRQDTEKMMDSVSLDEGVSRLIRKKKIPKDLETRTLSFVRKYVSLSKERYISMIDIFFDEHEFKPELFKNYDKLHPSIESHPSILWNLQRLKNDG